MPVVGQLSWMLQVITATSLVTCGAVASPPYHAQHHKPAANHISLTSSAKDRVPALIAELSSPSQTVRQSALRKLANIMTRADEPLLARGTHSASWHTRAQSVRLLSILADPRAVPAILPCLHDNVWQVRASAARALGLLNVKSAINPLGKLLLHDQNKRVRLEAAIALGDIESNLSCSLLAEALTDRSAAVAMTAASALANSPYRSAEPALVHLLRSDTDGRHREAAYYAAYALGIQGDRRSIPMLMRALHDRNVDMRAAAAGALGHLHDRSAVHSLVIALDDSSRIVRFAAAQALGVIGDPTAMPALLKSLKDANEDVREQSARALGRLRDPSAIPALIHAAFHDTDDAIPRAAALALGSIGDPAARSALIRLAHSKDPSVSSAARYALSILRH